MNSTVLRGRAEELAGGLPSLMADAEHLAATVLLGVHGRRRSGTGDEFWQFRPAGPGDAAHSIDWRRSGRSDSHFVQEKEWQAAQSIMFWVDDAKSMQFQSTDALPTKSEHAALVSLALAILLMRGGERVALAALGTPPSNGDIQLTRIAIALSDTTDNAEYGAPDIHGVLPHSRAVFVSDFLGDLSPIRDALTQCAEKGVRGAIFQVLDPQEESFPFAGRTVFESMGRSVQHETLEASDLRDRYLDRLAERKAELAALARAVGWQYNCVHTSLAALSGLLWLYQALERRS